MVGLVGMVATGCGGAGAPGASVEARFLSVRTATLGTTSTEPGRTEQALAGSSGPRGLSSLKYFFRGIQICKSLTLSGSGFSNESGCIDLYVGENGDAYSYDPATDYSNLVAVARADAQHFTDLLDPTSRAALSTPHKLSAADLGDYPWGLINWMPPLKFTADVAMNDATTLHSKDGPATGTLVSNPNGNFYAFRSQASASFTTGPAAEAIVMNSSGGSWFKFQQPFSITQADLDAAASLTVDLTFNPDGMVKGYGAPCSGFNCGLIFDPEGNALNVDFLGVAPVPHRSDETISKESYLATVASASGSFDVRVELYSRTDDAMRTIYGADLRLVPNASTTGVLPELSQIAFVEVGSDGLIDLLAFDRTPMFTGMERGSTVGASVNAKAVCPSGPIGSNALCVDGAVPGSAKTVSFKLVAVGPIVP